MGSRRRALRFKNRVGRSEPAVGTGPEAALAVVGTSGRVVMPGSFMGERGIDAMAERRAPGDGREEEREW